MPVPTSNYERTVLETGAYLMDLTSVEELTIKGKPDGADWQQRDRTMWRWKFKGYNAKDKERKTLLEFETLTGCSVGTRDSNLKDMLQGMCPEKTLAELQKTNTDDFLNKTWRLRIAKNQNEKGIDVNKVMNIEESDVQLEVDPFANE